MICTVCYGNRPQAKRMPIGLPAETAICTGCAIDIDKTLGYFALRGHGFMFNMSGQLHMIDLLTGESWPTDFATMQEAGLWITKELKGRDAPPTPSDEPKGTQVPKTK